MKFNKTVLFGLQAIIGSILIMIGTFLPWVTFLGGLETFSGIVGMNGKLLLVTGILSCVIGIVCLVKKYRFASWLVGTVGFAELAFCMYLLTNLFTTMEHFAKGTMSTMMVPGLGPGIFVATVGSFVVFSTIFVSVTTKQTKGKATN